MTTVTLNQINDNIIALKEELDEIKEFLEESTLDLRADVKEEIVASRNRPHSQFKTQEDMEKKFL
jgi:hypothetical protein